jgi:hypothetical protein
VLALNPDCSGKVGKGGLRSFFFYAYANIVYMIGKVDFIVCEEGGSWYIESLQIPVEIAIQPNANLVEYAKKTRFDDEPDVIYVGVYWRDQVLDEMGLTTEAAVSSVYERLQNKGTHARN